MGRERDKHRLMIEYARRFGLKVFVETGTYRGDTVQAMLDSGLFHQIHTVEVYEDRARAAQKRFGSILSVHCSCGDSAVVLPRIVGRVREPALFWLDAHHSGKRIARVKGLIETPVAEELEAVLPHPYEHVVLIDDAAYYRKYGGRIDNYPTTDELKAIVRQYRPAWQFVEQANIIRLHK